MKLGELKRVGNEYEIKGKLPKTLLKPNNDAYKALMEEIVKLHYNVIVNTPNLLKERKLLPFDNSTGELIARSSRIAEPFISETLEKTIPLKRKFRLLDIGCGTGVYIKRV